MIVRFLTKPGCGRCVQVLPRLNAFIEGKDIDFQSVNVDSEMTRGDQMAISQMGQKALPLIYFRTDNIWVGVNADYNFDGAHSEAILRDSEYLDTKQEEE